MDFKDVEKQMVDVRVSNNDSDIVSDKQSDDFDPPQLDDRYEYIGRLGQGGMGTVYKVKNKATDSVVALKVLNSDLITDRSAKKRFQAEVASLSELDHENIVSMIGEGQTNAGAPYLVMEYVEGKTLAELLQETKKLEPKRVVNLVTQLCKGLAHAHEKGIVHRDLKPSNIMVLNYGQETETIRILDFGIAQVVERTAGVTRNLTLTGEIFGTPTYMSPEQCEGKPIDSRSDIYAIGCMLFEMLTGTAPFEGANSIQLAIKHINEKPPHFPKGKRAKLKEPFKSLEAITRFCLAKDPEERYQKISALEADLMKVGLGKKVIYEESQGDRSLYFNGGATVAIVIYLIFPIILQWTIGEGAISRMDLSSQKAEAVASGFIYTCSLSIFLTCLARDWKSFKAPNKKMLDFWNLVESGFFSIAVLSSFLMVIFYLVCSEIDLNSPFYVSINLIASVTAFLFAVLAVHFEIIAQFLLLIPKMMKRKFVAGLVRKQIVIGTVVSCIFWASLPVLFPAQIAWVPYFLGGMFARHSPTLANAMNDFTLHLNPKIKAAYRAKSITAMNNGKGLDDAIKPLSEGIAVLKGDEAGRELLLDRAEVYRHFKKYDLAIADFTKLLALKKIGQVLAARAELYVLQGKYENAIRDYTDAIDKDPQVSSHYTARGLIYAKIKNYKRAIADLSTALLSTSDYGMSDVYDSIETKRLRRALVYDLAGQKALAAADYKAVISGLENSPGLMTSFAYRRLGNNAAAQKELERSKNTYFSDKEKIDFISSLLFQDEWARFPISW